MDTDRMPEITAELGDITKQHVDAIVNAANNAMRGGGGVDGAIHQPGGPDILRECIDRFPDGLATGDAGWTTAGELPARWVIHTVGPNYKAGQRNRALLESCYRRALQIADELGARTVAFPLISAGIYGWPLRDAIDVAVETVSTVETGVKTVSLVARDGTVHDEILEALATYRGPMEPLSQSSAYEWVRMKHDWDPAPFTDSSRLIIRERTDGEPGVAVILAETDTDYRAYHLGPSETECILEALKRSLGRG